jgi:hypothetical protein
VGDQPCADELTNESCEVGCEGLHTRGEVVGEIGAVLCQIDNLFSKGRSGFEIFVRDFCAHGDFGGGLDGGLDFLGEDGLRQLAFCANVQVRGLHTERSAFRALERKPILVTTRAYARLSFRIFASSGKCHPYHSFTRMAYVFSCLSSTSKLAMDWMIIVSTLSGENLSLWRDSECDRPRRVLSISDGIRSGMREVMCSRMAR